MSTLSDTAAEGTASVILPPDLAGDPARGATRGLTPSRKKLNAEAVRHTGGIGTAAREMAEMSERSLVHRPTHSHRSQYSLDAPSMIIGGDV